jgi:hypothetical protein
VVNPRITGKTHLVLVIDILTSLFAITQLQPGEIR